MQKTVLLGSAAMLALQKNRQIEDSLFAEIFIVIWRDVFFRENGEFSFMNESF